MSELRLIPSLTIADSDLVITYGFRSRKYVGDPVNVVRIFNELEVDELSVTDIDCRRNSVEPNFQLIEQIVSEAFMPVSYGGGVASVEAARRIHDLGVEKISINTREPETLSLISELAQVFGSTSVVGVADFYYSNDLASYMCWDYLAMKPTRDDLYGRISRIVHAGAGEIRMNDIERDGSRMGLRADAIAPIAPIVDVPLLLSGGNRDLGDAQTALRAGASGVCAGASLVLYGPHDAVLVSYPTPEERGCAI